MNTCAIVERECKGICPEMRIKRNQKKDCPVLYWKELPEKKKKLHLDSEFEGEFYDESDIEI